MSITGENRGRAGQCIDLGQRAFRSCSGYSPRMARVESTDLPEDSLLARFGGAADYRDCFVRVEPGTVSLEDYIERFYCSGAFAPERVILKLLGTPASSADARALARGDVDRFGAWRVVERRENEILLESKDTGTASWFRVQPNGNDTHLYFGSWVGNITQSGWKAAMRAHVWYSRFLLGGT